MLILKFWTGREFELDIEKLQIQKPGERVHDREIDGFFKESARCLR
jgi:hypothetical protein